MPELYDPPEVSNVIVLPRQLKTKLSPVIVMQVPVPETFAVNVSLAATEPHAAMASTEVDTAIRAVNTMIIPKTPLFITVFKLGCEYLNFTTTNFLLKSDQGSL